MRAPAEAMKGFLASLTVALAVSWAVAALAQSQDRVARLGVLAHRGPEAARQHWQPLSEYLSATVPGWRFEIHPVTLISTEERIAAKEIDFLITNPGHFVDLTSGHMLSAIATRERLRKPGSAGLLSYGTAVLVRKTSDIRVLGDLKGKTLAAVSPEAFGGFQIAWKEMNRQGVDPFADLEGLRFMGFPQDAIVEAVAQGNVDAGVVRSGLLESLEAEGRVAAGELVILNSRSQPGYPFEVTGHLFPEWPFVALPGVDKTLKEAVAIALLRTQEPEIRARYGLTDAWSTPQSYEGVRQLIAEYKAHGQEPPGRAAPWLPVAFGSAVLGLALLFWRTRPAPAASPLGPADRAEPRRPPGEAPEAEDPQLAEARARFESLTAREREVLTLICSGQPSKSIASSLGISQKTVEFHRSNLLKKTDAGSTAHLVQLATRMGFDLGFSPVDIRP